jgi:hypothetical protein
VTSTRPLVVVNNIRPKLLSPVVAYLTFCAGRACGNSTAPVHQIIERDWSQVDRVKKKSCNQPVKAQRRCNGDVTLPRRGFARIMSRPGNTRWVFGSKEKVTRTKLGNRSPLNSKSAILECKLCDTITNTVFRLMMDCRV